MVFYRYAVFGLNGEANFYPITYFFGSSTYASHTD
jgi:hypothetical protein